MFLIYGSLHFHWSHYSKLSFLPLCLSAIDFCGVRYFFSLLSLSLYLLLSLSLVLTRSTLFVGKYIHSSIRLRYDVDAFWIVFMHFTLVCINKIMCRMHIAFNDRVGENKKMTTNWKSMIFNRVIILFEFFFPIFVELIFFFLFICMIIRRSFSLAVYSNRFGSCFFFLSFLLTLSPWQRINNT